MSKSNKLTKPELREFLEYVTAHPDDIQYFLASGPSIKNNKRAVLGFLNIAKPSFPGKCTYILQDVDETLRDDIDIVKAACKEGFCIFRHISIRLKQETNLVRHILEHGDSREYRWIGECVFNHGNVEFFKIACERDESNFWYASDEIKKLNRELAMSLIRGNGFNHRLPKCFIFDEFMFEAALLYELNFNMEDRLAEMREYYMESFSAYVFTIGRFSFGINELYRNVVRDQDDIESYAVYVEKGKEYYYKEYMPTRVYKKDNPRFLEIAQFHYADTLEKIREQLGFSWRLIYEMLRDDKCSMKYFPEEYKNDFPIPESIVQTLPKEFQELIEKHKGALPQLLTYNPSFTQEDADALSEDFRALMKTGVKNFTDIIDFLDSRIGGTFRSRIQDQWRQQLEVDEKDPYDFLNREGPWEAYYVTDLATLYQKILPEIVDSKIGPFDACDECKLLFHPHKMSDSLYYEKDMHICEYCEGNADIAEEVIEGASPYASLSNSN